ncbi:MAG: hypothetical protein J5993_01375 [Clostridia bacterium]|nr:hypothetical protein [Clostridia bacterium]
MTNPIYDPYQVLLPVYADGTHLKQALLAPIEEANRAKTVKVVYGVLEQDGYLSHCIRTFAPKAPKLPVRVILKIALYLTLFMGKQTYMVTDQAVSLCKKLGKGGVSGFVNSFLRNFDESKVVLPEGDEGLSVKYGYPLFLIKKLKAQYGDRTESILSARSQGVTVRFVRGEEEYLAKEHIDTPFEKTYIFRNFARDERFDEGDYTFQSVGSIAIANIVPPCETMLDACAAPGGKSVLLASKCKNVTSFELYEHRLALIRSYAERMGVKLNALRQDSSVFDPNYRNKFDGILCDVPCSGVGTIAENPDLKLRKTEEQLRELRAVQLGILSNVVNYLKEGGTIVYSTCSVLREENDDIIEAFLKEHNFHAEKIDSPLAHEKTKYGLQFLPDTAYGAGFYVCRLAYGKD